MLNFHIIQLRALIRDDDDDDSQRHKILEFIEPEQLWQRNYFNWFDRSISHGRKLFNSTKKKKFQIIRWNTT